jgi:heat shock protein HtpX
MLVAFPALLLGMVYLFLLFTTTKESQTTPEATFMQVTPFVILGTAIWFVIAWFFHSVMIMKATASHPLARMENKRVYNLVENLCIANGMKMPAVNVIEDDSLNAFASGINDRNYTVSLSRGMINYLDDDELESVIAHELTHIRNRDVRMLMVSIIFVGIFSFIANMLFRGIRFGNFGGRGKNSTPILLIALLIAAVAYLISLLLRFAISRSREYMADAGSAEMTRKPYALANALRKISADPMIEAVKSRDVSQLFIENPQFSDKQFSISKVFATHPPIDRRIALLEQYV